MTTADEIRQWIQDWEGSTLDFKDSRILGDPMSLAKLMVAFANTLGGHIVIGIKDDRTFEGLTANAAHQTHIVNIARNNIDPSLNVTFENLRIEGNDIYIITILRFTLYPHALKTSGGKIYYIRVGDSIREPSPQEMAMLFGGSPQNVLSEIRSLRSEFETLRNQLNQLLQGAPRSQARITGARENVIGLTRTFQGRWTSFINSPPESQVGTNLDEFQMFLRITGDQIIAEAAFGDQSEGFVAATEFGGRVRRLGEKQFFIDGGKSWNEFIDEGNDLTKIGQRVINVLSG